MSDPGEAVAGEPAAATRLPDMLHEAISPTPELARKNNRWALSLFALFLVLFAATFAIGLVYLWLD